MMLVLMMLIERATILLLLAFLLAQPCILHLTESSNNLTDQSALLAFKSKISFGPNNTVFSAGNWSTTTNFCEWFGVSCSRRRQRVTALNLSYMGIQGTVSPHIGNLSFLISLDLTNNSFYGFLPHEISHLRRLRKLQLSNNLLEGSIPPTIHNCQKLRYFSLEGNKLNENHFSGTLPIDLCSHCPHLQLLYIPHNEFSEYGSEGRVSTKCDIYSYGIILLEIFTRKKPTDKNFVGELNVRQWIASLPDRMKVVDDGLLNIEDGRDVTAMKTVLSSILELGLRCSEELPDERLDIKDVVTQVNKIKLAILGNRDNGV